MAIDVIGLVLSGVVAVGSIVASIFTTSKKNKKARTLEILANVTDYVKQAETIFGTGNGTAKLQWVLTKVQIDCVKNNLKITDAEISNEVEKVLETPEKKRETVATSVATTTQMSNTNNVGYGQINMKKENE